jgi:hypothetical protein
MTYKHNQQPDEHTPLWVKLVGGFIAATIGGIIGLWLSCTGIVWYLHSCEYNDDCIVYNIVQKL